MIRTLFYYRRHKRVFIARWILVFVMLFLLFVMDVFLLSYIRKYRDVIETVESFSIDLDKIREFDVTEEVISYYLEGEGKNMQDPIKEFTLSMVINKYSIHKLSQVTEFDVLDKYREKVEGKEEFAMLYECYKTLLTSITYFPVPRDLTNGESVSFDNSWGGVRNFGGDRTHEGCDIMTTNNQRGYFPIVSITDGIVEKKGWLKLGGYRIGIRGTNGCYYYYAHLYSYAPDLEEGDVVKAGQLLGFMGDSGYGEEEGTVGMFDVHLHMGLYINWENSEISINPFPILKYLEHHKLAYYF